MKATDVASTVKPMSTSAGRTHVVVIFGGESAEHDVSCVTAAHVVRALDPEKYRVIVTPNEYGDFLSDMACGMIGSLGLGASASYSFDERGEVALAMFDPAGGTAPDIAGKGVCNPSASLLAFAMLLTHCGYRGLGTMVDEAVRGAIAAGERTRDLGGTLDTAGFTAAVKKRLLPTAS